VRCSNNQMLRRGRYRVWSAVRLRSLPSVQSCLPREEEGLPVHDHRILRDGGLELRDDAAMAAGSTRHDRVVVGDVRCTPVCVSGTAARHLQASPGLCQMPTPPTGRWSSPCPPRTTRPPVAVGCAIRKSAALRSCRYGTYSRVVRCSLLHIATCILHLASCSRGAKRASRVPSQTPGPPSRDRPRCHHTQDG
jgi:hypothetical protein